jgi:hypothetical protein
MVIVFGTVLLGLSLLAVCPARAADRPGPKPTPTASVTVTPEPTSTPTPPGSSSSGGPLGFLNPGHWLPDPKTWAADIFSQVLITLLRSIADGLNSLVKG